MERTFCMIKPDGVQRRLVGKILQRFEEKGLQVVGLKLLRMNEKLARELYSVHQGKPFYEGLVRFIISGPVVVMAIEGARAIDIVRKLMGATFGFNAEPGTIRGDFTGSKGFNLIHGSDAAESVRRELPLFFREEELVAWRPADLDWVFEAAEQQT